MANPAATPPPPTTEDGFDPLEFWIRHRGKIILYSGLLLLALLAFGIYEYTQRQSKIQAAQALAKAEGAESLQKVADEHGGSAAAASAHLLLAEHLREEGKLAESDAQLRTFIQKYPNHQLITGAYTSLATNAEAQNKLDEALEHHRKVTGSYPASFSAPVAWLGQARILQTQGKTEDARRAYETVITQFAQTSFAQEAFRLSSKLAPPPPPPAVAPAPTEGAPAAPAATPATPGAPAAPAPAPDATTPAAPTTPSDAPAAPAAPAPAAPSEKPAEAAPAAKGPVEAPAPAAPANPAPAPAQ